MEIGRDNFNMTSAMQHKLHRTELYLKSQLPLTDTFGMVWFVTPFSDPKICNLETHQNTPYTVATIANKENLAATMLPSRTDSTDSSPNIPRWLFRFVEDEDIQTHLTIKEI